MAGWIEEPAGGDGVGSGTLAEELVNGATTGANDISVDSGQKISFAGNALLGSTVTGSGADSTVLGNGAAAGTSVSATVVGQGATATGANIVTIGQAASATGGDDQVVIGTGASDRKSTRLNSSHKDTSRMPSSA